MVVHHICDGCEERIPSHRARFQCLVCKDYDSCSECHSLGRCRQSHLSSHRTRTIQPDIPDQSQEQSPATCESKSSDWGRFVTANYNASPMFCRLFDAIYDHFTHLDCTLQVALMDPECISTMYEVMGYGQKQHMVTWVQSKVLQNGGTLHHADRYLIYIYRKMRYEYILASRLSVPQCKSPVVNGMPVLTYRGFRTLLVHDLAVDPDGAYIEINRLLKSIPPLIDPATGHVLASSGISRSSIPNKKDQMLAIRAGQIFLGVQTMLERFSLDVGAGLWED